MKPIKLTIILFFGIIFQSCCTFYGDCEDDVRGIFIDSQYTPVLLERTDFEASVALTNPTTIGTSGKIYIVNNLLFINELHKGFHIYNNSDPTNPRLLKFLEAPGSTDLAIRENMIYINQATDLIVVQYNEGSSDVSLKKRIANTFPPLRSPDGFDAYDIPENSVVVDWKLKN